MEKHRTPIKNQRVKGAKSTGISFSTDYAGVDAAIAAGGTLDELLKWDNGEYPVWFMARVMKWHEMSGMIDMHRGNAGMGG